MKIAEKHAVYMEDTRHHYVAELAKYSGLPPHEALTQVVSDFANSNLAECVVIPDNVKFTPRKGALIAKGTHRARAYMAQASMEYVVSEGYIPEGRDQEMLYACMVASRASVTDIEQAIDAIPRDWPEQVVARVRQAIIEVCE